MTPADDMRRREAFITATLELALDGVTTGYGDQDDVVVSRKILPAGTPHGADACEAVLVTGGSVWDVDGPLLSDGFAQLWEDRRDNGKATGLEGVSTAWRDRMLQARAVNSTDGITPADAVRILRLALDANA